MRAAVLLPCLALLAAATGCVETTETKPGLPVYCLDKPDPGPCDQRIPMYYYDYPSDTCRVFQYGGCQGHVPFETRSACEDACVAGNH
jgi:hypothetical protein